ncbi:PQQ-binding-like beta-propeller repeat protein [Actinoplanes sp. NPDC051851]|uniref:outer membrane protein assembly factor BamB family protein n=1 Tax=Actinoplanes sp. NPDC051851 TaxID=3154753 RepID=UPI00344939E3
MTLIELDRETPLEVELGRRPPLAHHRRTGLLLAVALLAVLGGGVPATGMCWRLLGVITTEEFPDGQVQMTGGQIYTVDTTDDEPVVTAWAPGDGLTRLWSDRVPVAMAGDDNIAPVNSVSVRQSGEVVLLTAGFTTTAVDAATGRTRWTSPISVTVLAGNTTGVTVERVFRPGTEYDQDSGDPGPLYFTATGEPHTEAPIRTEVRGIDLASGGTLWTATPGGSVNVDMVAGEPAAVLITASSRLTLRDLRTGAELRAAGLPKLDGKGPSSGTLLGDVALVRYEDAAGQIAYDARTLTRLWRGGSADAVPADPVDCENLLCDGAHGDVRVLDPRTGRTRWRVQEDVDLTARAGYVLETDAASGEPVRLADVRTGVVRADLTGWTGDVPGTADQPLLLWRAGKAGTRIFAVVTPGHPEIQRLGTAAKGLDDCDSDGNFVLCRSATGLRVWAYRI